MSCLMCNELLRHHMCELCNIFEPSSPSWHMLLTHMYLWTNQLCISLNHILVHLRLSLNYQNQTRTFHPPSPLAPPWPGHQIWPPRPGSNPGRHCHARRKGMIEGEEEEKSAATTTLRLIRLLAGAGGMKGPCIVLVIE